LSIQGFSTISELSQEVLANVDSYETISFDMFDTLLVRRTHDPDLVKNATTKYIVKLAEEKGVWATFNLVESTRNSIEAEHRKVNGADHPDHEANYIQFMPEVLKSIFGSNYSEKLLEKVTAYELKMESAFLVVRADFVTLLDELQTMGKRLFLLSDMYLPGDMLKTLLADKKLDHYFEAIVSSADSFKAKASGAGFTLLENNYSLDKNTWLHIGDNAWSDGKQASEFGISSYLISDPLEKKRLDLAKRYDFLGSKQMVWAGRNIQQLMLPLDADNAEVSELYGDGYQLFSYIFGTMMLKMKDDADNKGIKKLYFCAREGWLLKQCWEIMAPILWPAEYKQYELHYLYVSRLSLAKASRANAGLSFVDIENALRPINNRDFTDVARIYGLDIELIKPFLKKHGLQIDSDISAISRTKETLEKLYLLLEDESFNDLIKKQAQDSNKALCNYLSSEGFFEQKEHGINTVGLIDIGWVGTIQSYLVEAVSHRADKPVVQGYLMSSVAAKASLYPETQYSHIKGLIYDEGDFSSLASILNVCRDVFEEVTRASHPTLLSYNLADTEKGFELVYRSEEHESFKKELEQFELYSDVHKGIFDGIKRFAEAVAICKYETKYLQQWCEVLIQGKLGLPTQAEVNRLTNQYHQDDFNRQGKQRKLSKFLQKQVNAEQTVWTLSSHFLNKFSVYKLYLLRRFMKNTIKR